MRKGEMGPNPGTHEPLLPSFTESRTYTYESEDGNADSSTYENTKQQSWNNNNNNNGSRQQNDNNTSNNDDVNSVGADSASVMSNQTASSAGGGAPSPGGYAGKSARFKSAMTTRARQRRMRRMRGDGGGGGGNGTGGAGGVASSSPRRSNSSSTTDAHNRLLGQVDQTRVGSSSSQRGTAPSPPNNQGGGVGVEKSPLGTRLYARHRARSSSRSRQEIGEASSSGSGGDPMGGSGHSAPGKRATGSGGNHFNAYQRSPSSPELKMSKHKGSAVSAVTPSPPPAKKVHHPKSGQQASPVRHHARAGSASRAEMVDATGMNGGRSPSKQYQYYQRDEQQQQQQLQSQKALQQQQQQQQRAYIEGSPARKKNPAPSSFATSAAAQQQEAQPPPSSKTNTTRRSKRDKDRTLAAAADATMQREFFPDFGAEGGGLSPDEVRDAANFTSIQFQCSNLSGEVEMFSGDECVVGTDDDDDASGSRGGADTGFGDRFSMRSMSFKSSSGGHVSPRPFSGFGADDIADDDVDASHQRRREKHCWQNEVWSDATTPSILNRGEIFQQKAAASIVSLLSPDRMFEAGLMAPEINSHEEDDAAKDVAGDSPNGFDIANG
eukprot:CAMPEP_0181096124 /NCGR_PEP_ID=MMETSP1071-20121207/10867_1 /TAXON_ID=35127 /ORGANISM="Thalassiosira sp., Strain NH16" /LENGTH=607 /DNA_ID=CAMNT_0023178515 /DNA_START=223 /DNA_END=2042 /DNA_ORIENTATION=-